MMSVSFLILFGTQSVRFAFKLKCFQFLVLRLLRDNILTRCLNRGRETITIFRSLTFTVNDLALVSSPSCIFPSTLDGCIATFC